MAKKIKTVDDLSTEDKIKEAARKVFMQKGYSATRTRDIAEEADINLALLNYYFRSKEKLFDLIMIEVMQQFVGALKGVLNNADTSLTEKVSQIVSNYTQLFQKHPDLPLFILGEIQANPQKLVNQMQLREVLFNSVFFKQILEAAPNTVHPMQWFLNLISLTVFPFVAGPLLKAAAQLPDEVYQHLLLEREQWIPVWLTSMMENPK